MSRIPQGTLRRITMTTSDSSIPVLLDRNVGAQVAVTTVAKFARSRQVLQQDQMAQPDGQ